MIFILVVVCYISSGGYKIMKRLWNRGIIYGFKIYNVFVKKKIIIDIYYDIVCT